VISLASAPVQERTLTGLPSFQSMLKGVPLCLGGPYDRLLDAATSDEAGAVEV